MLRKRIHQRDGRGANLLTVHLGPGLACAWVFLWSWRHQPGGGTSHGHNAALILLTSMVTDHYSRCFPWKGSSVQSLRRVRLFAAPLTAAHQASLSITNSRSLLKLMAIKSNHPTISSSVVPFSSSLQSFPASESFPMSQLFASGGQSTGVSASASVLPMNIQD